MESSGFEIFKGYLNLVHRKNILFVTVAIIIISIFIAACFVIPEKYEAKSMVFIESNVIGDLVSGIAVSPSMEDRLDVLVYSMKSRSLLLKVIDVLDLDLKMANQRNTESLIRKLQEDTEIKVESDGKRSKGGMHLFTVSFKHNDPVFARDYVNTLVNIYIEENLSEKREEARGANRFLSEQILFFKNKLEDIDRDIVRFRTEKGVFVSVNESRIVDEIKDSEEKLEELKIMKMEYKAKSAALKKDMKKEKRYTSAFLGNRGDTAEERILSLRRRLNELLVSYTENYPEVLAVRAEIASLKEQIRNGLHSGDSSVNYDNEMTTLNPVYQDLKEELSKISSELAALDVREQYLIKIIEGKKAYLREIPAEKKKLAELEREKDSNMKIYEELILRFGQSEVSSQMEIQDKGSTFRIVDPAILPSRPVSPNRIKIILLGLFAGIAGAFGFVYLIDSMDHTVKSVDTLKQLNVPILGMIPKMQVPEELKRLRRKNITVYTIGSMYMLFVVGVVAIEMINRITGLGVSELSQLLNNYLQQ